jgi:hypothetical protein
LEIDDKLRQLEDKLAAILPVVDRVVQVNGKKSGIQLAFFKVRNPASIAPHSFLTESILSRFKFIAFS